VGDVTHMREMRHTYKILIGKHEGMDHLEDINTYGRIIFN
jgi:hypothetical protein